MSRREDHGNDRRRREVLHAGFAALMVLAMLFGAVGISPQPAAAQELNPRLLSERFTIPNRSTRSKLVSCPKRHYAIGGGVKTENLNEFVTVKASAPTDSTGKPGRTVAGDRPRKRYVAVRNLSTRNTTADAYVLCLPYSQIPGLRPVIETYDVLVSPQPCEGPDCIPSSVSESGRAPCAAGSYLVGGGVAPIGTGALSRTTIVSSGPIAFQGDPVSVYSTQTGDLPDAWYANFTLFNPPAATFRLYAICVSVLEVSELVIRINDFTVPSQQSQATVSDVSCKPNEQLISGGVLGPTAVGSALQVSRPLFIYSGNKRRFVLTGWRVAVGNGDFSPVMYRAMAICQPPLTP